MPARTLPARGFTLVELMVAVLVIGLLSAIAYPAYQEHIIRTHRAAAAACLQELALQMERRYTISLAYDQPNTDLPSAACINASANRYLFGFGIPASASAYQLQATPTGAQSGDPCGTLRLDHQGQRSLTGSATDVQSCWR